MLATVCCAVLSGFPGYEGIAQWIHSQDVSLWHALGFTRQPPTWSCFRDLLMVLAPTALNDALLRWMREGLGLTISDDEARELVIDGKALRGTKSRRQRALQTLAILDAKTGGILSEHPVDPATNETKEKHRGRFEVCTLTTTTVGVATCRWPGGQQFLRLERRVTVAGVTKRTVPYAVTSLSREQVNADRLLRRWRDRRAIENRAFWVRDAVFGEDASRIRTGQAPHVMSVFRNSAMTLLRSLKVSNLTAALRQHALKLPLLLNRLLMQ